MEALTRGLSLVVIMPACRKIRVLGSILGQASRVQTETYTKRQPTHHDHLPSLLLGDEGQRIEIVYGEEKIFCTRPSRVTKAVQKYLVPARQAKRTNQRRTPFIGTL